MEQAAFEHHALLQRCFKRGVDHFLACQCGKRRHRGDSSGAFQRLLDEVCGRHNARHQPRPLGLCCIHHPASKAHFHRLCLADRPRQPLRSAHAGGHRELDFGLAKLGIIARNDEIGHHRQLAPAAQRKARYRRNPRFTRRCDTVVSGEVIAAIHIGEGLRLHFLDVSTRRKGLFGTGQHRATLTGIGVVSAKCVDQVGQHLAVQRVQRLRTVERYQRHRAALLDQDRFVTRLV